jgi:hypothetical protein
VESGAGKKKKNGQLQGKRMYQDREDDQGYVTMYRVTMYHVTMYRPVL